MYSLNTQLLSIRNTNAKAIRKMKRDRVEKMSVQERDRVVRREDVYYRGLEGHIYVGRA